jgi:hypothetical protein
MAILNNSNAISSGGYDINNSLRFRSSASAFLNRTPGTAGNRQIWTYSIWVKRGSLSTSQSILSANVGTTNLFFNSDNTIAYDVTISGTRLIKGSTAVFRDPSAWYHVVFKVDTTQATAANRILVYVNNVNIDMNVNILGSGFPAQNAQLDVNNTSYHSIGRRDGSNDLPFDGYLTEVNLIDGQALTPSSFGETDTTTGVWQPAPYTGTYGTNGFYLKFSDIATTSGSNAGLGKDFSGNANYWTTNNISVTAGTTYDAMIDSPTLTSATVGNYAVWNSLWRNPATSFTYSNGNMTIAASSISGPRAVGTIGMDTSAYYWEVTVTSLTSGNAFVGINLDSDSNGTGNAGYGYISDGNKRINNVDTSYGATYTTGDVIGVAFDATNRTLTFYKNNVSQGTISSVNAGTFVPWFYLGGATATGTININFGQRPFTYTPPSGFVALNTFNLPTPTILQGNKYMDATTYTGTGSALSVTNAGAFKPDFVWAKCRSASFANSLYDSVRGTTKQLSSNLTDAEDTQTGGVTSFNSNGFSVGSFARVNDNGQTFVGWQWQAGQGTTSSNTSGTITSTVSVNATAGFSVVTYTGTGANATVGHGLGVAPKMVIVKNRTTSGDEWCVWHTSLTNATYYLYLNATSAQAVDTTFWNSTAPSSTVISLGSNGRTNRSSSNMVCYAWAEIAGFSKFGSYTGNGSADGPFVYTGFRPKFILIKSSSGVSSWILQDTSRNIYNAAPNRLFPNTSDAEVTSSAGDIDILSNGFKIRNTSGSWNTNASTYIYMAFAENPFKNANAR